MINWKGYGSKWSWRISRYCPSIHLEGLKQTTKKLVRVAGVLPGSWIEYITNANQWRCCGNHLAGFVRFIALWSEIHKHFLFTFQVNVCLECMSTNMKTLKRRFIRCSAQATITHLKKFIAKKVLNGTEKYRDVSLTFACYIWWCMCVCTYVCVSIQYC
jgi:hypothetical protein